MPIKRGESFAFDMREVSGALGDLGTLLPLTLATIAVVGLAPMPVLLGFGIFYIASGLYYRLPIPVQPMKAVAAVLLTAGISPGGLAASGVVIGLVLLLLGVTGWISRLARVLPQSVLAGLQLGLGLALALLSLKLMATMPAIGAVTFLTLLGLLLMPLLPAAMIALTVAIALARALDVPGTVVGETASAFVVIPSMPSLAEIERAIFELALPQLSLTLTNAVVLTALLAHDYYGPRAAHVTSARLSITNGLANLLLTPFGALPMCHGAGGLIAHHRFGARTGAAPIFLGVALVVLALLPGGLTMTLLAAIPAAGLGALLFFSSSELALTKRLFDCKPSCWPVIATTAAITVWINPLWGLFAGIGCEAVRVALVRAAQRKLQS
ncbi:MAG TPA: putative sulfate/molybdate transporter [Bosea sp. (in: a-proteobacteria)]|jgi:predicted benzoate:H+ symporter BenE|uniref:putative sulfate/molybdate transporter n=1 Tax=Bosea sp. (in: a-proteobacteria) TaxID=1871050 RepID=UPI002E13DD63|nr:putative sulfate/molybdate transporter [Bosea sp. (in: a-proteobacteria)]